MRRVARALRIREGEGRVAALTVGTMATTAAGLAIGQSGIDGLFFSRFGVENLPILYLIQGPLLFLASLGATGALARFDRRRAFTAAPVGLVALLLAERLAAATGSSVVLPILWLSVSVAVLVQSLFTWGLAGLVTDTRQAKRLFPLFGAGSIAGAVLGGLVTRPLASAIGASNLLLVWAALLVGAFALGSAAVPRRSARRSRDAGRRRPPRRPSSRPLDEIGKGLAQVRRSSLVAALAAAAICFSVLYYSVYLPFSAAAAARYPSADALAGFFGLFSAVTTGAALAVSVVVANRLLSRIGVAAVVAILAIAYVMGFGVLIATDAFAAIVLFRFAQMVLAQGLVSPAWEALVNVIPPSRRDQTRAFLNGGPTQVGTMIAGVVQLAGQHSLSRPAVAAIGLGVAVLTVVLSIRIRRTYTSAVVDALREGRPQVFGAAGEEPFGGLVQDAVAVRATLDAVADPDPRVRRVAVHALAEIRSPEATDALIRSTTDDDPEIRARALHGLSSAGAEGSIGRAREMIADPAAEVRIEAASIVLAAAPDPEADRAMRELLEDRDPLVRARAVEALVETGGFEPSLIELHLSDPSSSVRTVAIRAVATWDPERLVAMLGDREPVVREAAADALATTGRPEVLVATLSDPALAAGALHALEHLRAATASAAVRAYALGEAAAATSDRELASMIAVDGDDARSLLRDSLLDRGRTRAANAIRAAAILTTPDNAAVVGRALDDLGASDGGQVANALEAIESATDGAIVRPVLPLWEPIQQGPTDDRRALERSLEDADPWIRACAELVASRGRGDPMDVNVATLSVMERVLFLRKVPLFADLAPVDLKRVADVAEERSFTDDDTIAVEGEPGEEMHVVVSGTVRVVRSADGQREVLVARRTSGDAVGEMAIITNEPRIASLIAEGDVRTLRIGRKEFEAILRERPDTALAVMRVLSHRLAERSSAEQVV